MTQNYMTQHGMKCQLMSWNGKSIKVKCRLCPQERSGSVWSTVITLTRDSVLTLFLSLGRALRRAQLRRWRRHRALLQVVHIVAELLLSWWRRLVRPSSDRRPLEHDQSSGNVLVDRLANNLVLPLQMVDTVLLVREPPTTLGTHESVFFSTLVLEMTIQIIVPVVRSLKILWNYYWKSIWLVKRWKYIYLRVIIGTNKDRINITPSTTAGAKSGLLPIIKLIVIDSCVKQIPLDNIVRFGAR